MPPSRDILTDIRRLVVGRIDAIVEEAVMSIMEVADRLRARLRNLERLKGYVI